MKLKNLSIIIITCLVSCTNSTTKNETSIAADTTKTVVFKAADFEEQLVYNRAVEAVIWGIPAVNSELLHESLVKVKGDYNQIIYWSGLISSKNQTLTPNPDVIYVNPLYDTRQGPVVLEIPPVDGVSSLTGSLDDGWQTAIEDIGPAGVDKGKGGKYLILPPNYKDAVPLGYIPMPSSTYTGYAILRSNLTDGSPNDIKRAVDYGKKVKIYPLSEADNPSATTFVDLLEVPFSNTIPYNFHFFEILNQFIQREPWINRDIAMIDQLKTIGIEKGKTFQADARRQEILNAAIKDAHTWIDSEYENAFKIPFYNGTKWALPVSQDFVKSIGSNYSIPNLYPVRERAIAYSIAYFSAKHLGTGQFYLISIKDDKGQEFDGSKLYKLHLPAKVPVKLYWSVTVYDRETHALILGMKYSSRASTSPGLQKNSDGSVDIYFGAKGLAGKESNWVPTDPKRKFELLARFYGPEKGFFDKTWKMGDVEEVK
ncbi:Uncharacterized conserved protein [Flavobacterium sp. CF108]|uniref:DUF1254 domain-containing protein n=1 Tax=unclassified Flavobacterium TaxID=196869 RepID=UPI0008B11C08|nr:MULTISPECIES: DUF1254 domain-containing protein [unclassified Flavobacterium]SEN62855.1 Uncharacterized conserved protein [Flavobacterium sp. fv08]SHH04700.1 Uncharacterized conserved protein [Flavobacterium sp. CF108]